MSSSTVIVSANLGEFFRDEVEIAKKSIGVELCEHTEYYVVNLLRHYCRPGENVSFPGDEPLALLYKRGVEAEELDKIQIFKNLGDVSLYAAGFFTDFIESSAVDMDYYISMGGGAYGSLSDIVSQQRGQSVAAEVYGRLSEKFAELVELIMEVAMRARGLTDDDTELVRLYERWMRTGSERLHKMLIDRGLIHGATKNPEVLQ